MRYGRVRHLVAQPFLCPFVTAYSLITVANVPRFQLKNKRNYTFVIEFSLFRNFVNNKYMESSITERLKEIIRIKTGTATPFSSEIGVSQSTLSCQLNSKTGIQTNVIIAALNRYSDISAEWLMRGKGEMLISDNLPKFHGLESDSELDVHASLARMAAELEEYKLQIMRLEAQKDYLQERNDDLVVSNRMLQDELNKYQEPRKKDIV